MTEAVRLAPETDGVARSSEPRAVLRADGLVKSFRARKVVKGVSVEVSAGEVVGLLGPNGAGKTTIFDMIVGLTQPDEGSIRLNAEEITALPMYKRARNGIGYLPQESSVFRRLSVQDNILAILEMLDYSRAERAERVDVLLGELFTITSGGPDSRTRPSLMMYARSVIDNVSCTL